jgi:hypothetical protein
MGGQIRVMVIAKVHGLRIESIKLSEAAERLSAGGFGVLEKYIILDDGCSVIINTRRLGACSQGQA